MTQTADYKFAADLPITHPDDDRLSYAPFAQHVVDGLCNMPPTGGFTMAVCGAWGSGKSTLVNLIIYFMKWKPSSEQPVIVNFNPWMFSGQEDMTMKFFNQLLAVAGRFLDKETRKLIIRFAETVTAQSKELFSKFGSVFSNREPVDIEDLKLQVERALNKQDKKFLIVIDDIDRLTGQEMRQIFQLIKIVANFSKMMYVLAFDDKVVETSLTEVLSKAVSGQEYLEKIIQLPVQLPFPDRVTIRRLLFDKVNHILEGTPSHLFDQKYWNYAYYDGIDHFITTPRSIVRFVNALTVAYSAVQGKVNAVDFIAMEALRLFCPTAYSIIRSNNEYFIGHVDLQTNMIGLWPGVEQLRKFHHRWLEKLPELDVPHVCNLLMTIFPKLRVIFDQDVYDANEEEWARKARICCSNEDVFNIYFSFTTPLSEMTSMQIDSMLDWVQDGKQLRSTLVYLANSIQQDGRTKAHTFLEHLMYRSSENIPAQKIEPLVRTLLEVGDQLLRHEDDINSGYLEPDNETLMMMIIRNLLSQLPEEQQQLLLKNILTDSKSPSVAVALLVSLEPRQDQAEEALDDDFRRLAVSEQQLVELRELMVAKMRDWSKTGLLEKTPRLRKVLNYYSQITNEREVTKWVRGVIKTNEAFKAVVTNFLEYVNGRPVLELKWLTAYMDETMLTDRCTTIGGTLLNAKENAALQQLTRGLQRLA